MRRELILLIAVVALAAAVPVRAQPQGDTRSLQGDTRAWTEHPALHRVWERLQAACRDGCARADAAAFEHDALDLMASMAPAVGMTPAHMREHVKAIPRQLLTIGAEDPAILRDYGRFITALIGPT